MQIQNLLNWKSTRSYVLVLLLVIVLIMVTIYLSHQRLEELDKTKAKIGMNIHPVPDLYSDSQIQPTIS